MADTIRVGIIGGGWPGKAHARGYQAVSGFKVVAVADLIPARRKAMMDEFAIARQYADAEDLLTDKEVEAVSICLPNYLHAPVASAALRAGKHVLCEKPPATNVKEARQIERAAAVNGKVVLYALQSRFNGNEQAAHQAIAKGYAGNVYHARASWTRTRGIPKGTGWFTDRAKSGGGALIDIGIRMLDLAWYLLGQPRPYSVFGVTHRRFADRAGNGQSPAPSHGQSPGPPFDVEDAAFALVRFENGATMELACSWAINQPPNQNGSVLRAYGDAGAVDVYTPAGAVLYRNFTESGEAREVPLKLPKTVGHAALAKHFRECIQGTATPIVGAKEGVVLMEMIEGIYRSSEAGKSVNLSGAKPAPFAAPPMSANVPPPTAPADPGEEPAADEASGEAEAMEGE